MRYITIIIALMVTLLPMHEVAAQHTLGVSFGAGTGSFRPYPDQETRTISGLFTGGASWRYYTDQRYVGAIGIDVEFMERAYSYAPYASYTLEGEEHAYYTRYWNSIMVPFVWQPHVYMFHNHVRVFLDLGVTFSYNMASTYENEAYRDLGWDEWEGDYEYKTARDNRFCYGLMGGAGINYIIGRYEIMARARYYFGYSDILKNRNKYYNNSNDGAENPFYYTPTRSPVDNMMISVGLNYRLGSGDGFASWYKKREEKVKIGTDFNYSGASNKNSKRK
ncbi:MAG: outer membrane beta-barrel protein [Rikenellaceae bacterium]